MKTKQEPSEPHERHVFTLEEIRKIKDFLKDQTDREEIIACLDKYSCSLVDWYVIIYEAITEIIAKKRRKNVPCEKEREMLEGLSYMFAKIAGLSSILSDWHNELTFSKENLEKMIEQGET
ncbi:MAG: hypothetical protein LBC98_10145 [Prevotellaceae bacterium]|jgi:hypothetical protein|nr:hypothetical protein [Prevotellaceae bacterium]